MRQPKPDGTMIDPTIALPSVDDIYAQRNRHNPAFSKVLGDRWNSRDTLFEHDMLKDIDPTLLSMGVSLHANPGMLSDTVNDYVHDPSAPASSSEVADARAIVKCR